MAKKVAITTIDNPYDPITQFDDWYAFDELKGYHSCSLLARFTNANSDSDLNAEEENLIVENAIDRIIENVSGFYKKVIKEV